MEKSKKTASRGTSRPATERFLLAMAYTREDFKNKAEEYVGGAILEFYKTTLVTKLGIEDDHWIDHWMKEVHGLLDRSLVAALRHSIRGFTDRRKALAEVFAELKSHDQGYRRSAVEIIRRYYQLADMEVLIEDEDTEVFWERVAAAVEAGLAE